MADRTNHDVQGAANRTTTERTSDCDLVVRRRFKGTAQQVFAAWTEPQLLKQWWAPKSTGLTLQTCVVDAKTGGRYRFEFGHPSSPEPIAFFGQYVEVTPPTCIVWTNEESETGPVTTLTLEDSGGETLLALHERHPSKDALDTALACMGDGMTEQFAQLDALLIVLAAKTNGS